MTQGPKFRYIWSIVTVIPRIAAEYKKPAAPSKVLGGQGLELRNSFLLLEVRVQG